MANHSQPDEQKAQIQLAKFLAVETERPGLENRPGPLLAVLFAVGPGASL
jgi:hypothetical protein